MNLTPFQKWYNDSPLVAKAFENPDPEALAEAAWNAALDEAASK